MSAKIKFQIGIQNFGSPSTLLAQISAEKSISFADMRLELDKVEKSFETVKDDMMHIDPSDDHGVLLAEYTTKVVEEVDKCKKFAFQYLKDIPPPTLTTGGGAASPRGESESRPFSTTKRETVMLPHFSGDERTAYLKFPVWKKQWSEHIEEYEVKYRCLLYTSDAADE